MKRQEIPLDAVTDTSRRSSAAPTHTNAELYAISTNSHKLNRVDPRVMGTSVCLCVCI